jgi:hypothetical protein
MSWLSETVDNVRKTTDTLGKKIGLSDKSRKHFRYGVASMGGGMSWQYEYSRNKGMNSDEATKNSVTGGMQYKESRQMQQGRLAEEAAQIEADALAYQQKQAVEKARNQIAVRVRRGARADRPGNKSGTLLTGGLGTTGNGPATFAALLGM